MGGRALRPEEQAALVEEMTAIVEHSRTPRATWCFDRTIRATSCCS